MMYVPLHPDVDSLDGLHDRLALPVPAPTAAGIRRQITKLAGDILEADRDAKLAEAIGLPSDRMTRAISWGNECMTVLCDALSTAELTEMLAS